jgi:hypothetical protein
LFSSVIFTQAASDIDFVHADHPFIIKIFLIIETGAQILEAELVEILIFERKYAYLRENITIGPIYWL